MMNTILFLCSLSFLTPVGLRFMSTKPYTVKPIDWSPEAELLLGCARTQMDNEAIRRVAHS